MTKKPNENDEITRVEASNILEELNGLEFIGKSMKMDVVNERMQKSIEAITPFTSSIEKLIPYNPMCESANKVNELLENMRASYERIINITNAKDLSRVEIVKDILGNSKFKSINLLLEKYTNYDTLNIFIYVTFKADLTDNSIDIDEFEENEIKYELFKYTQKFICEILEEEEDLTAEEIETIEKVKRFKNIYKATNKAKAVPTLSPSTAECKHPLYMYFPCDNVISDFNSTGKKQFEEKPIVNQAVAKKKNVSIVIDNYVDEVLKVTKNLKVPTQKLMLVLMKKLNENNQYKETDIKKIDTIVTFTMSEYMELCGVKNEKEARKTMVRELDTLYNISIDFTADTTNNGKRIKNNNFLNVRICTHKGIKNSVVSFGFSPQIAKHIINAPITKVHSKLLLINPNINPHSFYLGLKFSYHFNMNEYKPNSNIIAVTKLMEFCPDLPTYEHVESTGHKYKQQIITPFEKDMDAINEVVEWEYCNSKYQPLTGYQAGNTDKYEIFITLFIKFTLYDYPETKKKPKAIKQKKK